MARNIRWSPKNAAFLPAPELARAFAHLPRRDLQRMLDARQRLAELEDEQEDLNRRRARAAEKLDGLIKEATRGIQRPVDPPG